MLVLAGPGSGKTHVISQRVKFLIEEKTIKPERILIITFTKAAALEMRRRCCNVCQRAGRAVFGTFHSVFYYILRTSEKYQNFSLINESEKIQMMKKILPFREETEQQKLYLCEKNLKKISMYKNQWPIPSKEDAVFAELMSRYRSMCNELGKLDFDDMILLCHTLFLEEPQIKEMWQERFDYILIDEFQDVNGRQYELTKMLAEKHKNLFVVGDDDQAIYSFRGSAPQYMKQILVDFPECRTVYLEDNFRCGANIVSAACKSICQNQERFPKRIRAAKEIENYVYIKSFETQEKEIAYIASKNRNADGEHVVLVRTNQQAEYVAEMFWREKIPCQIRVRRVCFYENVWVRDVIAALRFCACNQKRTDFLVFMNKPYRGISREILKEEQVDFDTLRREIEKRGQTEVAKEVQTMGKICRLIKNMDAYGAVRLVLEGLHYRLYLEETTEKERMEEVQTVLEDLLERAKGFRTVYDFINHAEQYRKMFHEEQKNTAPDNGVCDEMGKGIYIMTYHASKGLEFRCVYLPMLNHGMVPHGHMLTPEQMEEERRMFYVAMTRAKKELYLSWHGKETDASIFLKELTDDKIGT